MKEINNINQFIDEFNKFACEIDWDLEYHNLKELLVEFFNLNRVSICNEDNKMNGGNLL